MRECTLLVALRLLTPLLGVLNEAHLKESLRSTRMGTGLEFNVHLHTIVRGSHATHYGQVLRYDPHEDRHSKTSVYLAEHKVFLLPLEPIEAVHRSNTHTPMKVNLHARMCHCVAIHDCMHNHSEGLRYLTHKGFVSTKDSYFVPEGETLCERMRVC